MKKVIVLIKVIFCMGIFVFLLSQCISLEKLTHNGFFSPAISYKKMEVDFQKNKEYLDIVCEFLRNYEDPYLYLNNGSLKLGETSYAGFINDRRVIDALYNLNKSGYGTISKGPTTIEFQRWERGMKRRGIEYFFDGSGPDDQGWSTSIKYIPLSELNWYYFEVN